MALKVNFRKILRWVVSTTSLNGPPNFVTVTPIFGFLCRLKGEGEVGVSWENVELAERRVSRLVVRPPS